MCSVVVHAHYLRVHMSSREPHQSFESRWQCYPIGVRTVRCIVSPWHIVAPLVSNAEVNVQYCCSQWGPNVVCHVT